MSELSKRDLKRLKLVAIAPFPLLLPALDTLLALALGWRPRALNLKLIGLGFVVFPLGALLVAYLARHRIAQRWARVLLCLLFMFGGQG